MRHYFIIIVLVVVFCFSSSIFSNSATQKIQSIIKNNALNPHLLTEQNDQLTTIANYAFPAVVNIASVRKVSYEYMSPFEFFFDSPYFNQYGQSRDSHRRKRPVERQEKSLGSGFIISEDGYILTNDHVIKQADEIIVILSDGRELKAKLMGSDKKTDVALLKINANGLPYLEFGDSEKAKMGEIVLALGNPFSVGVTFTMGVISAKGRNDVGIAAYEDFIQTDAAINPGNSGGPLLNVKGEVLGMNTAILSRTGGYQGVGFTIPINMIGLIKDNLLQYGKVNRSYMGVNIQDLDPKIIEGFGLKGGQKGALISHVFDQGPGKKAGLKSGDVVIEFDDHGISDAATLRNVVALSQANRRLQMKVLRNKREKTIFISLEPKEKRKMRENKVSDSSFNEDHDFLRSLTLENLSSAQRERFGILRDVDGVLVTEIVQGGKSYTIGIEPGDIIQSINTVPVFSVKELTFQFKQKTPPYVCLINRDKVNYFVVID